MILPAMLEQVNCCNNNIVLIFESFAHKFKNSAITVNDEIFIISFDSLFESNDNYKLFCKGTSIFTRNKKFKF